jgi:hypothetical protein
MLGMQGGDGRTGPRWPFKVHDEDVTDLFKSMLWLDPHQASGCQDGSIKIWGIGAAWACERTLLGHTETVRSLVRWQQDKMAS